MWTLFKSLFYQIVHCAFHKCTPNQLTILPSVNFSSYTTEVMKYLCRLVSWIYCLLFTDTNTTKHRKSLPASTSTSPGHQPFNISQSLNSKESRTISERLMHAMNGPKNVFSSLGDLLQTSSRSIPTSIEENTSSQLPWQRFGSSPGMGMPRGRLEERLRGSHMGSPSTSSSNGSESVTRLNLLLPSRSSMSNKSETKSIEVVGEKPQTDLSTETVDFHQTSASFDNESGIQILQHEGQMIHGANKYSDNDTHLDSASKCKSTLTDKHSANNYSSRTSLCPSAISDDRNSLQGLDVCPSDGQESSDIHDQVTAMEQQVESQQQHILALQKRVEEINR